LKARERSNEHEAMNVCMVAYTFYESDNRVRRYAESLAQRGDLVEAIALQRPGQPAYEVICGVHVYRIQKRVIDESGPLSYLVKLLMFFIRSALLLARRHFAVPYQLIHVHSVPDFQVFAALVPRLAGAKIILDIHDIVPEFYASKFRVSEGSFAFRMLLLVERLSISFSHHVIIANHLWQEKLVRRSVEPDKCTAFINYPDCSIFYRRPAQQKYEGRFLLCYPGTLNWHQGVDIAIQAMALVRSVVPNALLLIIGEGPERENLGRLISHEGLEDVVTLCGVVSIEKVAEIMASVDLGVVPKRADSFGNEAFSTKIMEFMAMGVPVVASDTRVDRYYFNDNLVHFFKSSDPEDMARKILDLVWDKARREALRSRAESFISENSWDVKKKLYYDLVDRLVVGRNRVSEISVAQPSSL
jgi:glycosyltransferase involved in cell wall biosynthesis